MSVQTNEEYELLRRTQLERTDEKCAEVHARKVRVERCKWAVEDVRKALLYKTSKLEDSNVEADLQEQRRGLELTSIAADKQHDQMKEEKYQVKKRRMARQRAEERARVANGYENPKMRKVSP